jgi:hypothetical protein
MRSASLLNLLNLLIMFTQLGCLAGDASPDDRVVELAQPFEGEETQGERFLGRIELDSSSMRTIDARRIGATQGGPIVPSRAGRPGTSVFVEFESEGLAGVDGRLGLLPPRGAARQEVAFDMPGQPDDPRSVWVDVEIQADGPQRFELPAPGDDWHAPWAVVVLEPRRRWRSWRSLPARSGPRSEMLSDETRASGGRIVLGVVAVARRPARVQAWASADPIELDGVLDEPAWQHMGATLHESRTGEPGTQIDALLGGPTMIHFAWDAEHLYVAGTLPDRDLYAPHGERDDPLYRDEAFEVFVAGDSSGSRYLEHQVSARGVVFDARFPKYRKGDEGWNGSWRSAVALDGELERIGYDRGWTVELAFAWTELCEHTKIDCPPKPGQELRVNVFRLDKPDRKQQVGLALSPTIEPDFHAWANAAELELLGGDTP